MAAVVRGGKAIVCRCRGPVGSCVRLARSADAASPGRSISAIAARRVRCTCCPSLGTLLHNALPGNGQHRDQGRGRERVECVQAPWPETPLAMVTRTSGVHMAGLAQDPHPLSGRRRVPSPRGRIDEPTLEIRAAELTSSEVDDVEPVNATGSGEPARDAARAARPDSAGSGDRQRHDPLARFAGKPLPGNGRGP